jgi:hypothetical protein
MQFFRWVSEKSASGEGCLNSKRKIQIIFIFPFPFS